VDGFRAIRSAPELAAALVGGLIGGKVLKGTKFKGTTKPKVDINDPKSFNGKSAAEIDKELKDQGYEVGTYKGTSNATVYTIGEKGKVGYKEVTINNGGGSHTGYKESNNPVYVKINDTTTNSPTTKIILKKDQYEIPNTKDKLTKEDKNYNVIDSESSKPIAPKKTSYDDMDKDPTVPFELKDKIKDDGTVVKIIVPTEK